MLGWKKSAANDRVILYFVGSLTDPRKGFSLLVEALKLLPHSTLRSLDFQVLGSPYPKIDVLEDIGISYISLGFLRDEFSQIVAYNAADFLICPSYFDNSPNVVAEALCCGLPAIALPDTGGAEMLIHGVNGLIPESQAPSSLAELLFDMASGAYSFDRSSISSTARKTFGYPATCQKHENLYGKLL